LHGVRTRLFFSSTCYVPRERKKKEEGKRERESSFFAPLPHSPHQIFSIKNTEKGKPSLFRKENRRNIPQFPASSFFFSSCVSLGRTTRIFCYIIYCSQHSIHAGPSPNPCPASLRLSR